MMASFPSTLKIEKKAYRLGKFEGPLDLLLYLVKKHKINLYDIPIAQLTAQYFTYLNEHHEELEQMSEFYLMASNLLQIKSQFLLPRQQLITDEPDPRQELADQLAQYAKIKEVALFLAAREGDSHITLRPPEAMRPIHFEAEERQEELNAYQLSYSFFQLLKRVGDVTAMPLMREPYSVNEKLTFLRELLDKDGKIVFSALLLEAWNRFEVVCAFLAVLEATRDGLASIEQNSEADDIIIKRKAKINELEFD